MPVLRRVFSGGLLIADLYRNRPLFNIGDDIGHRDKFFNTISAVTVSTFTLGLFKINSYTRWSMGIAGILGSLFFVGPVCSMSVCICIYPAGLSMAVISI